MFIAIIYTDFPNRKTRDRWTNQWTDRQPDNDSDDDIDDEDAGKGDDDDGDDHYIDDEV